MNILFKSTQLTLQIFKQLSTQKFVAVAHRDRCWAQNFTLQAVINPLRFLAAGMSVFTFAVAPCGFSEPNKKRGELSSRVLDCLKGPLAN